MRSPDQKSAKYDDSYDNYLYCHWIRHQPSGQILKKRGLASRLRVENLVQLSRISNVAMDDYLLFLYGLSTLQKGLPDSLLYGYHTGMMLLL